MGSRALFRHCEAIVRSRSAAIAAVVAALLCGTRPAAAQNLIEVRVAQTKYRFVDWSYAPKRGPVVDVFYVGVPGSNELNAGGGYAFKFGPLTLTPLVYAVAGKEDGQRGVKIAMVTAFEKDGWKLLAFGGDYVRGSGGVSTYQVLDTFDATRMIRGRWELGLQTGFFRTDGAWNTQVGPMLKLNDRLGAWALSSRFGAQNEVRIGRVTVF
jgi:hypothetical protein